MNWKPLPAFATLLFAGCSTSQIAQEQALDQFTVQAFSLVSASGSMPNFFDCLRENEALILSAHRGGPVPGFPENAIETMAKTVSEIPALLEIDVERTADGVLVLMHDATLERTTTGKGKVGEKTLEELGGLRLVDNDGLETEFHIPTLGEALEWSEGRTMLALDRKGATAFEELVAATKAHDAFDRVLFATYSLDDAIRVHRLAPEAMIVAPLVGLEDAKTLEDAGVDLAQILHWGGTEVPTPSFYAALADIGVESAFAPLGWWTGSWDSRITILGDDTLYLPITRGVHLVATDRAREVARVLPGVFKAQLCVAANP